MGKIKETKAFLSAYHCTMYKYTISEYQQLSLLQLFVKQRKITNRRALQTPLKMHPCQTIHHPMCKICISYVNQRPVGLKPALCQL